MSVGAINNQCGSPISTAEDNGPSQNSVNLNLWYSANNNKKNKYDVVVE